MKHWQILLIFGMKHSLTLLSRVTKMN